MELARRLGLLQLRPLASTSQQLVRFHLVLARGVEGLEHQLGDGGVPRHHPRLVLSLRQPGARGLTIAFELEARNDSATRSVSVSWVR